MSYTEGGTVSGYSIQFWKDYVAPKLSITDVRITTLKDNNAIMGKDGLLSPICSSSNVVCVGAAAISITEDREVKFDFLASYFTNNVRILTTITPDPADILNMIIAAVWQLLVGVIIFFWFFNMIMAPVVWACEMLTVSSNELPIFMPSDKAVDKYGGKSSWLRSQYIVTTSFKSAVMWTVNTFLGAQLARPNSKVGQSVLLPLILLSSSAVGVVTTAGCSAIFIIDTAKASSISGVADLGSNHKVCYNTASSFNTNLVAAKSSEQGFITVPCDGTSTMLEAYYDNRCDAVIYDDVILQGDLVSRRQQVRTGGRAAYVSRVEKSGVVGGSMKWDPYGFLMTSGNPQYETVNRAVVSVATDSTVREALETAHLRTEEKEKRGLDLTTFGSQWVWMPSAIGVGLIAVGIVLVYLNVACTAAKRQTSRASLGHSKSVRGKMRAARMDRGIADIALQPANELIHDMAFEMQDMQTTMHSDLEMLQTLLPTRTDADPMVEMSQPHVGAEMQAADPRDAVAC